MTVMTLDRNFRVVIFLGKVPMYCHHRTQTVVQRDEEPSVTSTNTPQMRISFRGTPGELRSFLAQLCLLAADSDYLWQLDASIARHPAGKRLGRSDLCQECGGIGRHLDDCLGECPHGVIRATCTECRLALAPSACGEGHQHLVPCSGEIWCP